MNGDRSSVIVVDAANVVGSRPDGWWRDRVGAARRLLTRLAALEERLSDTDVVVVLEGAACRAVSGDDAPETGRVRVVLASGSGDDIIVSVAAEVAAQSHHPAVTVVTADRELRQRVETIGATTTGPRWLLDQLDALSE
ncbi:YacP-like NYN domain-containing protein [Kribbella sp. VKM Ac-2571]|uniref:NYN domain-containing protein n=1 Tax=Kribbella sp. VKM Ac-2571 TaxID=2512222 RepID=UPI001060E7BE|nr:NYN domain-containing protein [Kribbella sp. VKM Ac-2571]TDO59685.1 YacP-like NYN domain-containing protein [Kribbella sp. VKM Ac-2571]